MQSSWHSKVPLRLWSIVAYLLRSLAGSFLTPAVIMTLGAALFAYIALGQPAAPLLRDLAHPLPADDQGMAEIGTGELMLAYSVLSFVVGLVSGAIATLGRRLLGPIAPQAPRGLAARILRFLKSGFFFTSLVFAAALLLIPTVDIVDDGSPLPIYIVFVLFYLVSIVRYGVFYGINFLADYVPGQRRSPREWRLE